MNDPFKPITREEAAGILSVSLTTLDELVKGGALPAPRALGGQRRLYWHPEVFYSHLHRALTTEEPVTDREIEGAALEHSHVSAASSESGTTSHRGEKTTRRKRHPVRARGHLSARTRQAVRIEKLNE